jgi:hypothetical protein
LSSPRTPADLAEALDSPGHANILSGTRYAAPARYVPCLLAIRKPQSRRDWRFAVIFNLLY